jgi:hypothetical protein
MIQPALLVVEHCLLEQRGLLIPVSPETGVVADALD